MDKISQKALGQLGEKIAIDYLQSKGYQILEKNYQSRFVSGPQRGEIDIVAKSRRNIFDILRKRRLWGEGKNTLHFVEVKTLVDKGLTPLIFPEEKVNRRKQRKIIRIAQEWLTEKKIPLESRWQIDIISIEIGAENKTAKIRHFENAVSDT